MAYNAQTQAYSVSERVLDTVGQTLERAAARMAHYRIYRESLYELSSLRDRDFEDLGLDRGALKEIAKEAADRTISL